MPVQSDNTWKKQICITNTQNPTKYLFKKKTNLYYTSKILIKERLK